MTGTQPGRGASSTVETQPPRDPPPSPKPGEPGKDQPMRDPPVFPERDSSKRGNAVEAEDPSPDAVIFDANKIEK